MQPENSIPVAGQPPASDKDGKAVQAEAQSDTEPFDAEGESLPELRKAADDLKAGCASRRTDPVLRAADGHLDVPDRDDE